MKLVILGTHVFAEEVADLVDQSGEHEVVAFAENWDRSRCEQPLLGRPVVWVEELGRFAADHAAVCAIGSTRRSGFVGQAADAGLGFATVTHPTAVVSPASRIGAGSVVSPRVVVAAHTRVGDHVILNRGALVGHHTEVGDYVTVSPGANVAGCVTIGEGAYIGMGAVILDRISVGAGSVIGAGAVVTRDVPPGVQAMGVPARVVKEGIDGR